jgi:hypothetical protein
MPFAPAVTGGGELFRGAKLYLLEDAVKNGGGQALARWQGDSDGAGSVAKSARSGKMRTGRSP